MATKNNDKDGVKITGTANADTIHNGGNNVTIAGGKGDDSINSWGEAMAYVYSGGNDTIEGFRLSNTLVLGKLTISDSVINPENGDTTLNMSNGGSIVLKQYWNNPINTVASVSDVESFNVIYNDKSKTKINGTSGSDLIETDESSKVTINAGAGNDYVRTSGEKNFVDLGNGNDTAENWGENTTINAGAGNDYVDIYASQVSINAGAGNDSIGIGGDNVTIVGGAGNDLVWGGNVKTYVYSAGNDTIDGFQRYDTLVLGKLTISDSVINPENGDTTLNMSNGGSIVLKQYWNNPINTVASVSDVESFNVIYNDKSKTKINGTSGSDLIETDESSKVTIKAGAGNDYVRASGAKNSIALGNGDDTAENWGENTTINAGAGDDNISNNAAQVSINAGAGNDSIRNGDSNVTIAGGKGNNYINSWGEGMVYVYGGGNDTIEGFQLSSTVVLGKAKVESSTRDYNNGNIIFNMSDGGSIVFKEHWYGKINTVASVSDVKPLNIIYNDKNNAKITGTSGSDLIDSTNENSGVTINAGAGNDYTKTGGEKNSVDLGNGDDVAENWGNHTTINGGKGNDYIENYREDGEYSSLVGGAGNDSVVNHAPNTTIVGGDGNDSVVNDADNNVTIYGGADNDYLEDWGNNTAYVYSGGNDTISRFNNLDSIVLDSVKINSSVRADGTVTLNLSNKKTLTLQNYWSDNINIVKSIEDVKNWNIIYNYESDTKVAGTSKDDYIENGGNNVTISGGKGNDYLEAGGVGTAYVYGGGNDTINYFNNLDTIVLGSVKVNSSVRADGTVTLNLSNKKTLTLTNYWADNINTVKAVGDVEKINIIRNLDDNQNIKGTSKNDYIENSGFNATITGGKGDDIINNYEAGMVYVYKSGDGNDLINGFSRLETLVVTGAKYETVKSDSDLLVKVGNGTLTLSGAADLSKPNIVTSIKNITPVNVVRNDESKVTIKGKSSSNWIRNFADKVTITGGASTDDIYNNGANVSIDGGDGNDLIRSEGSSVKMDAGAGDDTLDNWSDSVTIEAGTGNDYIYNKGNKVLFQYASGDGNDTIVGFNGTSTLSIAGSKYSTKKSGDNVIVTVDKGKITLQGAASVSSVNIELDKILTVTDKTKSPVTVDATTKVIDASARTKAVKMTGNGLANTIIGGKGNDSLYGRAGNDSIVGNAGNDKLYGSNGNDTLVGGAGKDTLWGDAGNDSLYGGDGADTFIYKPGEGTDTIFDYESGDMLKILKSDGKDGGTFTSSSFKSNKLTLAISGGGKVIFSGVSASDTFNINGTSYSISGTKLK